MSDMQRDINRGLVQHAVSKAMFCPGCEHVLEMKRAVLATREDGKNGIACGDCYDKRTNALASSLGMTREALDAKLPELGIEVLDGRKLW